MSRSYRKVPIIGMTYADSEKMDKRMANRKLRASIRQALSDYEEEIPLPVLKEVSNVWTFAKDGRQYLSLENRIYKYLSK